MSIAELNDNFRKTFKGGKVLVTAGINNLSIDDRIAIIQKVQNFTDFTKGDDPYGEHDFGAFDYKGNRIFFKIDYYDKNCEYGSEDPSNPDVTTRVLTIMFAEEY